MNSVFFEILEKQIELEKLTEQSQEQSMKEARKRSSSLRSGSMFNNELFFFSLALNKQSLVSSIVDGR